MPRAIVFDLFNTLVSANDFMPPGFRRVDAMAEILGVDRDHFGAFWWHGECYQGRYRAASPTVLEWIERYCGAAGRTMTAEQRERIDHALGHYQDRAISEPRASVLAALDGFRATGLATGLLSNADEREARTWDTSPLRARIDAAFLSFSRGFAKPEPESYRWVLDALGVEARDAIFVGDGMSEELPGARAAGFGAVAFMRGFVAEHGIIGPELLDEHTRNSDLVIDRLEDLQNLL